MRDSEDSKKSKTNAGLAGAGGGTLIAVIANQLPDSNVAKPVLQYSAPSISILLTALTVWIQVKVVNFVRDREFNRFMHKARQDLEKRIANPHISEEHRSVLQKRLEELDEINFNRIKSRIKALTIVTDKDFKKTSIENKPATDQDE